MESTVASIERKNLTRRSSACTAVAKRVHLDVLEAGLGQAQLRRDVGHVDDVVGRRVEVEAEARNRLFGAGPVTWSVELLDHHDVAALLREVTGGDEPILPRADDDIDGSHQPRAHR